MPPRASRTGYLRLSLVAIPIRLYNVVSSTSKVSLNQLHKGCHHRVRQQLVCPEHGALERDAIVKGYEYEKDQYVVIDDADLEKIKLETTALQKGYSAQEVSQLLKIEPGILRRWEQFSLIRSQEGRYDFQDLVSLRTTAELVRAGVRKETIARSLRGLASVLPGTDRPLSQMKIVVENPDSLFADHGEFHLSPDGQLLFNFDAPPRAEAAILDRVAQAGERPWRIISLANHLPARSLPLSTARIGRKPPDMARWPGSASRLDQARQSSTQEAQPPPRQHQAAASRR